MLSLWCIILSYNVLSVKDFCTQREDEFPASRTHSMQGKRQDFVDLWVEGTYNRVYLNNVSKRLRAHGGIEYDSI